MLLGIVTVLYRSQEVLPAFIASMNAQRLQAFTVLFVENETEQDVCETLIKERATFQWAFIRNPDNLGVAKGNNQGMDYFAADPALTHLMFLNNDIEVGPDFLHDQLALMTAHPKVHALAPKMYYHGSNNRIWYAGGCLSYVKNGPRHWGHNKPDKLCGKSLFAVDYAPTCSLLVDWSHLQNSGIRMWETLFVYQDDFVFCVELKRHGIHLYYTPEVSLQHKISTSTGGSSSDFSRYYITRNWAYTARKLPNYLALAMIPLRYVWHKLKGHDIECKALRDAWGMA